jgi:hypothetical protein
MFLSLEFVVREFLALILQATFNCMFAAISVYCTRYMHIALHCIVNSVALGDMKACVLAENKCLRI